MACTDAARAVAPRRGLRANVANRSLYPPPATPPFPAGRLAPRLLRILAHGLTVRCCARRC